MRRDPDPNETARLHGCLIATVLVFLSWGYFIKFIYHH